MYHNLTVSINSYNISFAIIFLFLEICPEKISRWEAILYVKMCLFQSITFNNTLEKNYMF